MSAKGSACNWSTRTWSGGTSTSRGSIEVTPSIGIERRRCWRRSGKADGRQTENRSLRGRGALCAPHPGGGRAGSLRGCERAQARAGGGRLRRPGDGSPHRRQAGDRLLPGLPCHAGGCAYPEPGVGRRLREGGHPRDRTSPPPPQGSPDRTDRYEAPPDLHRPGPRRKIQLRKTGGGSREEDGRGGQSDAILSGRGENFPLGRRPLLRGQKNRGSTRGRGLQPGREPPAAIGGEKPGFPETPFPYGRVRLQGVPQGEPGGLEPETPDRGEGRAVRDSPGHRGPARLLRLRREGDGGSPRPGRGKPRRRGRRKGRPSPEDFLFGDRRDRGGPDRGPRRLQPEVRRGREGRSPA